MPSYSTANPPLTTQQDLADLLNISEFELKRMLLRPDEFYTQFQQKKKSGAARQICAPHESLKEVQRKIKSAIIDQAQAHEASMGYRRGVSIVDNAAVHVGKRFVLNLDLSNFFTSIKSPRVAGLFVALGYEPDLAFMLARLCCFKHCLPQGAPSSPAIANLICHKLDRRLSGFAGSRNLNYTRYCDDITISGDRYISKQVLCFIQELIKEEGFEINPDKTRLLTQASRQIVTGLVVNEKVSVPRKRRRQHRAALHQAQQTQQAHQAQQTQHPNHHLDLDQQRSHCQRQDPNLVQPESLSQHPNLNSDQPSNTNLNLNQQLEGYGAFLQMVKKGSARLNSKTKGSPDKKS